MSRTSGFTPFYPLDVMFVIDSFIGYVKLVEDKFKDELLSLVEVQTKIQEDINVNGHNYSDEYISHLEDLTYEDYRLIEDDFIYRFRDSVVIQLFSYLEIKLVEICNNHTRTFKKEYFLKDLRGENEIDKVKIYLKNSVGIDISSLSQWQFINDLRKIRNKITHHNSFVKEKDQDFKSILKFSDNNFQFEKRNENSETYKIVFDKVDFLFLSIKNVDDFLVAILNDKKLYL